MAKDFNNLGSWLPPKIAELGVTVEKFARRVGLSRAQLYRYFEDRSRPSEEAMVRICHALGVPLEEGLRQYTPNPNGRPRGSGGGMGEVHARQR